MTQPNNPALKEQSEPTVTFEASFERLCKICEQHGFDPIAHEIGAWLSAALQRETGGEADFIPWNHLLQISAEDVVKRYNNYAQGHLPSDCNRELARLIAYFAQQQLSQLRAANGELDDKLANQQSASDVYQARSEQYEKERDSLTQQLADAQKVFPDIGPDPLKLTGEERFTYNEDEVKLERLRKPCGLQQGGVPNQTALVWRADLSWLIGQFAWREAGHKLSIARSKELKTELADAKGRLEKLQSEFEISIETLRKIERERDELKARLEEAEKAAAHDDPDNADDPNYGTPRPTQPGEGR